MSIRVSSRDGSLKKNKLAHYVEPFEELIEVLEICEEPAHS